MNTKQQRFDTFRASEGKKAEAILLSLSKKEAFVKALSTDLGQELLRDLLEQYEKRLEKVINGTATERDKEGLVIFKCLAGLWADRINSYNHNLEILQKG